MADPVVIYGKDSCGYTSAARREYGDRGVPVAYHDVQRDPRAMERFLELSGGDRRVPLIVDRGRVIVGWGGS
jgi:glutaredoxin